MAAPFRATAAFSLCFAATSLGLAWLRIDFLQRFDARWPAELHWGLEVVSWPFVAILCALIYSFAATLRRCAHDRWQHGAGFGIGLAMLIAAPSILGANVNPPLASALTWVLVIVGPVWAARSQSRRRVGAPLERDQLRS